MPLPDPTTVMSIFYQTDKKDIILGEVDDV